MGKAARAVRRGTQSEFVKKFEALSGRYSIRQIWEDWVLMCAISISNTVDQQHAPQREQHYMTLAKKYNAQELQVFAELLADMVNALEVNPDQDFLGEMYVALDLGNDHAGQFFTPYCVCKAMTKITAPDIQSELDRRGWISVSDPACGAGALLVAFANECMEQRVNYQSSVLFVAQDIDYLVGCMCYLQLSILGCPGYVKIGDSLAKPSTSCDPHGLIPCDDGNIWYTPFYFREDWHWRRQWAAVEMLFPKAPDPVTVIEEPSPILEKAEQYTATETGQLSLF